MYINIPDFKGFREIQGFYFPKDMGNDDAELLVAFFKVTKPLTAFHRNWCYNSTITQSLRHSI